jgi:hypothetical protein
LAARHFKIDGQQKDWWDGCGAVAEKVSAALGDMALAAAWTVSESIRWTWLLCVGAAVFRACCDVLDFLYIAIIIQRASYLVG